MLWCTHRTYRESVRKWKYKKKVLSHIHVNRPINFIYEFFSDPALKSRSFGVGIVTSDDVKL